MLATSGGLPSLSLFPRETQEPPIDARTFVKFNIPLPDEIRDFYYNLEESKHTELNRDFKAAISACRVEFMKSGGSLSVITKDPTSQRRAGMLQEMHFRFEVIERNSKKLQTHEKVEVLVEMYMH